MDKSNLLIGTTVYLKKVGNNARGIKSENIEDYIEEYTIKKIGRKYLEVWRDEYVYSTVKFHLDSLTQATKYTADWELYFSKQEILDKYEADNIRYELRKTFDHWSVRQFTLDQLRRIKAIIEESEGE